LLPSVVVNAELHILRCIKDWISTVLVLTQVVCNISGKEDDMSIYGVISNRIPLGHAHFHSHCPTQSHVHTFLNPQSIPTELLICRSNCSHFFFLDSSITVLNRFLGQRMSNCVRVSQKTLKIVSKHTHVHNFVFLLPIIELPIQPFIAACALVHSSV